MRGPAAERFVVFNLRLMAALFAVVGLFSCRLSATSWTRSPTSATTWVASSAPPTARAFWLALAFAYMVVITGICLIAQADVVRYRPLLLLLAVGKAASSLTSLGFYLFDQHVLIYLLNFLVDGSLILVASGSGR